VHHAVQEEEVMIHFANTLSGNATLQGLLWKRF